MKVVRDCTKSLQFDYIPTSSRTIWYYLLICARPSLPDCLSESCIPYTYICTHTSHVSSSSQSPRLNYGVIWCFRKVYYGNALFAHVKAMKIIVVINTRYMYISIKLSSSLCIKVNIGRIFEYAELIFISWQNFREM